MSNSYKFGQWYSATDIKDELPEEYDWVLVSVVDWKNPKLRFIEQSIEQHCRGGDSPPGSPHHTC